MCNELNYINKMVTDPSHAEPVEIVAEKGTREVGEACSQGMHMLYNLSWRLRRAQWSLIE